MLKLLTFLALVLPLSAFADNSAPIKVGAIYAMTGDWASWGKNCQQGTELALAELAKDKSAPRLQLILEDSQNAKPINAITAYRKLADTNGVKYILGPMSPEEYAAVAPLADRGGIPLLPFVSSQIKIPAAMFMWMDPEIEAQRIADYVALRHSKIAILSSNQEWESEVGKVFQARLIEKGLKIPVFEELPFDSSEVRSHIAKLKHSDFDAVFVTSYMLFSKYLKGLHEAKIKVPVYSIEIDASAVTSAGEAAEGLVFIRPAAASAQFAEAFKAMWKAEPDIPASQCYDSVMVLARAISSGVTDKDSFAKYFTNFPLYTGASGTISVENGKTVMSTEMFRVEKGTISKLSAE